MEFATLECVDWFKPSAQLEAIGNISSAEVEALHYAAQENLLLAA